MIDLYDEEIEEILQSLQYRLEQNDLEGNFNNKYHRERVFLLFLRLSKRNSCCQRLGKNHNKDCKLK